VKFNAVLFSVDTHGFLSADFCILFPVLILTGLPQDGERFNNNF